MPARLGLECARLSDQIESLVFFFQVTLRLQCNTVGQVPRRICEEGTGDVRASALFENDHYSEYQIRGRDYSEWHANGGPFTFPGKGKDISFDRTTVRLETLSSFDFGPKKGFCLAQFGQNLPSPPAPPLVSVGPNLWHPLLAGLQRGPWPYSTNPMQCKLRYSFQIIPGV